MTQQCQACDHPAPQGISICGRCELETKNRLRDQETFRRDLLVVLTRTTRIHAPNDGGRGASLTLAWAQMGDRFLDSIDGKELRRLWQSLPPARPAANALHSQRALLVSWCRLLFDQGQVPLPADDIRGMSLHLFTHMPILRKHEIAGELVLKLRGLVRHMAKTLDLPEDRTRIKVGPCPNTYPDADGHEEHCPGEVSAIIPADLNDAAVMRCDMCKAEWDTRQWGSVGRRIEARKGQLRRQVELVAQFRKAAG